MDKLCECGCGQPAPLAKRTNRRMGLIKGHPQRFILGHRWAKRSLPYHEEDRSFETPCWIYDGYINPDTGYGYVGSQTAHTRSFRDAGGAIPPGKELDHRCRVRPCIRPSHLEPVTRSENMRRSPLVGRYPRRRRQSSG